MDRRRRVAKRGAHGTHAERSRFVALIEGEKSPKNGTTIIEIYTDEDLDKGKR